MTGPVDTPNAGGGRWRRWLREAAIWLFGVLVATGLFLALLITLTPQGHAGFHTVLFVLQVLEIPVKPQPWFTDEPLRHEVHYRTAHGAAVADVYRPPDGKPRAAVLLFLGANAAGRDDPGVITLGNALARAGYVTMFHWSPTMGLQANIDLVELDNLVWAFLHLEEQGYVDRERVGLGGFCVGASFSLVAASDPRIRDRVGFVNAFGPYFDARMLLLQAASRTVVYDGQRTPWEPDSLTLRVLANELIEALDDPSDAAILTRHYLDNQPATPEELEGLSPVGRTVARLLDGVDLSEFEGLYQTLPAGFREDMTKISPSAHLSDIHARLLVMHDRYDRLVPAAESRRLLEATRERGNVRYTELLAFEHVRPGRGGIFKLLAEAARLYRHMYYIIRIAA
jgi:hypothetical protein